MLLKHKRKALRTQRYKNLPFTAAVYRCRQSSAVNLSLPLSFTAAKMSDNLH